MFRLERLRDELVLFGPELRGWRRGRHGRQAVQHLTDIKLLHFPPGARDGGGREHRVEISREWWGGKPLSLVSAARLFKPHILKVFFTVSSMAKSLGCDRWYFLLFISVCWVSVYSDSASRCVSNYLSSLSHSLSLARSLLLSTQRGNIAAAPRMRTPEWMTTEAAFQTLFPVTRQDCGALSEPSVTMQKWGAGLCTWSRRDAGWKAHQLTHSLTVIICIHFLG